MDNQTNLRYTFLREKYKNIGVGTKSARRLRYKLKCIINIESNFKDNIHNQYCFKNNLFILGCLLCGGILFFVDIKDAIAYFGTNDEGFCFGRQDGEVGQESGVKWTKTEDQKQTSA